MALPDGWEWFEYGPEPTRWIAKHGSFHVFGQPWELRARKYDPTRPHRSEVWRKVCRRNHGTQMESNEHRLAQQECTAESTQNNS